MARLIDADALLKKISRMIDYCQKDSKVNGMTALFQVGDAIMDCKSVDAVEVVRCKDCRAYLPPTESRDWGICRRHSIPMRDDNFCNYGEREKDG